PPPPPRAPPPPPPPPRRAALGAELSAAFAPPAPDWLVRGRAGGVPAGLGHPLSRLPRVQEKVGENAGVLLVKRRLLEQAAALRFSGIEGNLAEGT
ncbi:acyl-CoA dehydrogenase, partial [Klebsiella pneumoniae]|nr:acyl-CoA dehydrogenase [Klebsiella pneumoniae]